MLHDPGLNLSAPLKRDELYILHDEDLLAFERRYQFTLRDQTQEHVDIDADYARDSPAS